MSTKEADWKVFQKHLPQWRERYLEKITKEVGAVLLEKNGTATEKFWKAKKTLDQEVDKVTTSFDGCSRSNMQLQLVALYCYNIINDDDLLDFSEELRERILSFAEH